MSAVTVVGDIRSAVDTLLPEIRGRSDEIEALRRLPLDLVQSLKSAGVFRVALPRSWGGPELSPREQTELVELLSAADPSVGWCAMIGSDSGFYSAWLDDDVARSLWTDLDDVTAGWIFPAGSAMQVDGGYVVNGRWSFGSGCTHADVLIAGVLVVGPDGQLVMNDGVPHIRTVVARSSAFEVIDTWDTTGLAGSGSNDYSCHDLFVPVEHTFSFANPTKRPGALYSFNGAFMYNMPGVPLGLARRSIDDALALVAAKVVMPEMTPMASLPRVRAAVAEAESQLRSARSFVYDSLDRLWKRLSQGEEPTIDDRLDLVLSRAQAFRTAKEVSLAMVELAGTSGIRRGSLDRMLRDAVTMGQHAVAGPVFLEAAGALAVGAEPPFPVRLFV